jgi:hypothetical protein
VLAVPEWGRLAGARDLGMRNATSSDPTSLAPPVTDNRTGAAAPTGAAGRHRPASHGKRGTPSGSSLPAPVLPSASAVPRQSPQSDEWKFGQHEHDISPNWFFRVCLVHLSRMVSILDILARNTSQFGSSLLAYRPAVAQGLSRRSYRPSSHIALPGQMWLASKLRQNIRPIIRFIVSGNTGMP